MQAGRERACGYNERQETADQRREARTSQSAHEPKRARAKARRAEQKARRLAAEQGWKAQVAAHFGFLETTYGFAFANVDGSSWWELFVRYDSPQFAV